MSTMNLYDMADTWNNGATTFTAIKMNVTDTASAGASRLFDLQVGGVSDFYITKLGAVHGKRVFFDVTSTNTAIISASNYSLTGANAQSLLDLAGTWNTSGTPTLLKANVTDTASAAGSLLLDLQVGGTSRFRVDKVGDVWGSTFRISSLRLAQGGDYAFADNAGSIWRIGVASGFTEGQIFSAGGNLALSLTANVIEQRNGTNAQAFRLYNTFTDASNYERLELRFSSNFARLDSSSAGSGTARSLIFSASSFFWNAANGGATQWTITNAGHFLAGADNTYDIGASGASRPRNIFIAGLVNFAGSARMGAAATGVILLENNAGTDFNRLQFGGTIPSFPALKRSSATLQVRLADDSAFANFECAGISTTAEIRAEARVHAHYTTAIPAGGTTGAGVRVSSATNFGVFFGSGAPTLSAAKGSLYLRSDGSTTNDRMYVNTDGATTWTAVTTAA
jgi:hypothetical protein